MTTTECVKTIEEYFGKQYNRVQRRTISTYLETYSGLYRAQLCSIIVTDYSNLLQDERRYLPRLPLVGELRFFHEQVCNRVDLIRQKENEKLHRIEDAKSQEDYLPRKTAAKMMDDLLTNLNTAKTVNVR